LENEIKKNVVNITKIKISGTKKAKYPIAVEGKNKE
jgi:hypothetical protein